MKTTQFILLVLLMSASLSCSETGSDSDYQYTTPVLLGDPYILEHEGMYYAYGTNASEGIEVYTSEDMTRWTRTETLALHGDDTWAGNWYWAPEVYYIEEQDKFFMYFTAEEHIGVATSDSPLGPFKQETKAPMFADEKAIDNSLYIDDDGTPYLFFVRFTNGSEVWVAELENDLKTIKTETLTPCISVSQDWERIQGRINEGPFVVKHKGLYYLTYSANHFESQYYGIGYAVSSSPYGPWTKYGHNPILQKPGEYVGVGHHSLFRDAEGQLKMVFHAHYSDDRVLPRKMLITDINFTDDIVPVMQTGEEVWYPKVTR